MRNFTHLHVHTEASLLDGLARIGDVFAQAKANGQRAIAVTDHGSLGGMWKANTAAKEHGVKLIPGVELYLALNDDGTLGSRHGTGEMTAGGLGDDSDEKVKRYYHLTLLATSNAGWKNLVRICNSAEGTRYSRYPMSDMRLIGEDTEGLVALTGCLGGPVLGPMAAGNGDLARKNLDTLISTLGKENVFLEVMEHGISAETRALADMHALSVERGIPLVATNDSHYTKDCDAHAHDAWLTLRTLTGGKKSTYERPLDDPNRYQFSGHGYHVRSTDEMYGLFDADAPGHLGELSPKEQKLLAEALDNPLLPRMLAPSTVTPEQVQAANDFLNGHPGDDACREFVARVAREAMYLQAFGRPSRNEHHPRNWWHEACANTELIAERADEHIMPQPYAMLPKYPTPEGEKDNRRFLHRLISEGIDTIFDERTPEVRQRLKTEWDVIDQMGFIDYFLIVWDVVSWAKSTRGVRPSDPPKKPILVGPGRGSGAGSLIAYALGITGLDPLRHNLLFERFIEPGRSDWPDFDIDFERERREEILDYLTYTWGEGHVALIGTYGQAKSRRALKDAARLLGHGRIGAMLAKVVPVIEGQAMPFQKLLDKDNAQSAEFRRILEREGEAGKEVLDLALTFDGVVNGVSIHACGVIVSDQYLPDLIPLRRKEIEQSDGTFRERLITVWDSKDCEKFGLLKLDVLALRTLDIMHTAFDFIREQTGEELSIETIPHPSTQGNERVDRAWALLRAGRTEGIFQAEGQAMKELIQDVQPDNEEHLSAIYALFRPGPISAGMPEHYGLRKNGKESVSYDLYTNDTTEAEWLATVLDSTYGILAYQESMMRLGTVIAGFDVVQRSTLRRAIGKKDRAKMAEVKDAFLDGAQREFRNEGGTVYSPVFAAPTAERIWAMFEGAASYAFNASHSMAYAYLGYYTAYLKANWPGAFGAAILANTSDGDRRVQALLALPAEGITVLPPDVNRSLAHSAPEGDNAVRIGLDEVSGLKNIGAAIVSARAERRFTSVSDVVSSVKMDGSAIPSNKVLALIEAGAMDDFGTRYGQAIVARFSELPAPVPTLEWGLIERAARQRQRLGVSLGEHPLRVFRDQVKAWRKRIKTAYGETTEAGIPVGAIPTEPGAMVTAIGLLAQFKEDSYRGGQKAAIVLEGSSQRISGVMWDRELSDQRVIGIPQIGWPVAVTARVTVREFEKEDDEGNTTIVQVRQLTVQRIDVVDIDDPVTGSMPPAPSVPTFRSTQDATVDTPVVEVEAEPAPEPEAAHVDEDDVPVFPCASVPSSLMGLRAILPAAMFERVQYISDTEVFDATRTVIARLAPTPRT